MLLRLPGDIHWGVRLLLSPADLANLQVVSQCTRDEHVISDWPSHFVSIRHSVNWKRVIQHLLLLKSKSQVDSVLAEFNSANYGDTLVQQFERWANCCTLAPKGQSSSPVFTDSPHISTLLSTLCTTKPPSYRVSLALRFVQAGFCQLSQTVLDTLLTDTKIPVHLRHLQQIELLSVPQFDLCCQNVLLCSGTAGLLSALKTWTAMAGTSDPPLSLFNIGEDLVNYVLSAPKETQKALIKFLSVMFERCFLHSRHNNPSEAARILGLDVAQLPRTTAVLSVLELWELLSLSPQAIDIFIQTNTNTILQELCFLRNDPESKVLDYFLVKITLRDPAMFSRWSLSLVDKFGTGQQTLLGMERLSTMCQSWRLPDTFHGTQFIVTRLWPRCTDVNIAKAFLRSVPVSETRNMFTGPPATKRARRSSKHVREIPRIAEDCEASSSCSLVFKQTCVLQFLLSKENIVARNGNCVSMFPIPSHEAAIHLLLLGRHMESLIKSDIDEIRNYFQNYDMFSKQVPQLLFHLLQKLCPVENLRLIWQALCCLGVPATVWNQLQAYFDWRSICLDDFFQAELISLFATTLPAKYVAEVGEFLWTELCWRPSLTSLIEVVDVSEIDGWLLDQMMSEAFSPFSVSNRAMLRLNMIRNQNLRALAPWLLDNCGLWIHNPSETFQHFNEKTLSRIEVYSVVRHWSILRTLNGQAVRSLLTMFIGARMLLEIRCLFNFFDNKVSTLPGSVMYLSEEDCRIDETTNLFEMEASPDNRVSTDTPDSVVEYLSDSWPRWLQSCDWDMLDATSSRVWIRKVSPDALQLLQQIFDQDLVPERYTTILESK